MRCTPRHCDRRPTPRLSPHQPVTLHLLLTLALLLSESVQHHPSSSLWAVVVGRFLTLEAAAMPTECNNMSGRMVEGSAHLDSHIHGVRTHVWLVMIAPEGKLWLFNLVWVTRQHLVCWSNRLRFKPEGTSHQSEEMATFILIQLCTSKVPQHFGGSWKSTVCWVGKPHMPGSGKTQHGFSFFSLVSLLYVNLINVNLDLMVHCVLCGFSWINSSGLF